jgi:hypothetical protein
MEERCRQRRHGQTGTVADHVLAGTREKLNLNLPFPKTGAAWLPFFIAATNHYYVDPAGLYKKTELNRTRRKGTKGIE